MTRKEKRGNCVKARYLPKVLKLELFLLGTPKHLNAVT